MWTGTRSKFTIRNLSGRYGQKNTVDLLLPVPRRPVLIKHLIILNEVRQLNVDFFPAHLK